MYTFSCVAITCEIYTCINTSCSLCPKGGDDRDLRLLGHVGFDSFPDQLVTKCVNKGFDFNILCIGKLTQGFGILAPLQ